METGTLPKLNAKDTKINYICVLSKYYGTMCLLSILLSIMALVVPPSNDGCSSDPVNTVDARVESWLDSLFHCDTFDDMIGLSMQVYDYGCSVDDPLVTFTGSTLAGISYLYGYQPDSCLYYFNKSIRLYERTMPHDDITYDWLLGQTYNNLGLFYINLSLDYYKATGYFFKAIDCAKASGNVNLQVSSLANLALVHYFRKDSTGLQFAEQCYSIAKEHGVYPFVSNYCMAQSLYVCGRYDQAQEYALNLFEYIDSMPNSVERDRNTVMACNIYGKIMLAAGDEDAAVASFERSLAIPSESFKSDAAETYLEYGEYLMSKKDYASALDILLRGLKRSRDDVNYVHLIQFYDDISRSYESMGNLSAALHYHKEQSALKDSVFNTVKEYSLSEMNAKYRLEVYENQIKQRQITILKGEKRQMLLFFLLTLSVLVTGAIWYWSRKRNAYYENIVRQLREKAEISRQCKVLEESSRDGEKYAMSSMSGSKGEDLYHRLVSLIESEKIYRDSNLTIDRLALILGTNRSYLSRVVNEYAGMNFNRYINKYRVADAVESISENPGILIKQLSADLGFKSTSTFYKAFQDETGISPSVFRSKVQQMDKADMVKGKDEVSGN